MRAAFAILALAGCAHPPSVRPISPASRNAIEAALRNMAEATRNTTFMPTSSSKEAVCVSCKRGFSYEPKYFDGREVFTPQQCPACEEIEVAAREKAAAEGRRQERIIIWGKLGLPFTEPGTETAVSRLPSPRSATCLRWVYGPKGLFMCGPSGVGKSRTEVEILRRQWIEHGHEFQFVRWHDFQCRLDDSKFGQGIHSKELAPLIKAPITAFDDVGKGRPTEKSVAAFFNVVDARVSAGKPLIITTKYSLTRAPGSPFETRLAIGNADAARDIVRRLCDSCFNAPFGA